MMQRRRQQQQPVQETAQPPPPVPAAARARVVRVIAGADVQDMDLAGHRVGVARIVAQTVLGVGPGAVALVDGREVDEEHVLGEGQLLEFVKHAGQKGAPESSPGDSVIEVAGNRATWRRNGKPLGATSLHELVTRAAAAGCGAESWRLYPRQVRLMVPRTRGQVTAVVIEMPPGPRQVRWIAGDSRPTHGPGGQFEERRLSFPWVVLVVVFRGGEISGVHQAFYRTAPIGSLDDELYFTNLLNVARGYDQESWVCLMNLGRRLGRLGWEQRIDAVTQHFWQAAFNRSSEIHEGNSFVNSMARVDRRLANADAWEAATQASPYFALEVRWQRAPHNLGETVARMLDLVAPERPIERVEQLVTLMQQEA